MNLHTHVVGAVLFFMVFTYLTDIHNPLAIVMGILITAGVSVFPDVVERYTGEHREIGHSLIWILPLGLFGLVNLMVAAALLIGFLSHIFLDIFTPNGSPILYPFQKTDFKSQSSKRRIKTGTKQDKAVFIFLTILLVPMVLINFSLLPPVDATDLSITSMGNDSSTPAETIQNDINLYFELDDATNKNITVHKGENTTTILVTEIQEGVI